MSKDNFKYPKHKIGSTVCVGQAINATVIGYYFDGKSYTYRAVYWLLGERIEVDLTEREIYC